MDTMLQMIKRALLLLLGIVLILCGESNAVELVTTFGQSLTTPAPSSNPVLQLISGINPPAIVPASNCPICECGVSNEQRIVGGAVIDIPNKYPWLAAIFHRNWPSCGGSLITDRHVVTAAHCTAAFDRVLTTVFLMEHNVLDPTDTNFIKTRVEWFYQHPLYSPTKQHSNDIAVLLLDTVVTWTDKLRPICMPTPGESYDGFDAIAAGWGAIYEGGPQSKFPKEVHLPIMSNAYCRANTLYQPPAWTITDDMMCAGYLQGGVDTCQGDSGGPLIVQNPLILTRKVFQLVGATSFGNGCAEPDYPGVYSRVTANLDWIRQVTADGCYCSMPLV